MLRTPVQDRWNKDPPARRVWSKTRLSLGRTNLGKYIGKSCHHGDSRPVIGADSPTRLAGQFDSGDGCFRVLSSASDSTLEDRARLGPALDSFPPNSDLSNTISRTPYED